MVKCPYDSATEIICCTIGIMVIQWGYIEEFINQCVLLLYHTCKGKNTKYQYDKNAKKINIPNLDHSEYTLDDLSQFRKMFQALASDLAPFVDRLVKDFAK